MVSQSRAGSFSPNPAHEPQTRQNSTLHAAQTGILSAAETPIATSPTGANHIAKIAVAQVYLLLSAIKEDKESSKWEVQVEQLRKVFTYA